MAVAVPDTLDVGVLSRQAEAFDRRAERLRAEARDLTNQAIELRLQIDRQQREPITIMRQRVAPERDARLLTKLTELLEQIGPCSSTILAEHLNLPKARVLGGLNTLEKSGAVKRSGIRRGTVWGLAEDQDLDGHHANVSARNLVLAAGQKAGTFTVEDLDGELQMLTTEGIRRACKGLVEEGLFSVERVGRQKVYAWEKPEGKAVNRPKHAPPEAKLVQFQRRNGGPVAGTGRASKPTDKDVADLFDQIKSAGAELTRQENGHWRVMVRDQVIEVLPGTPSDWRGIRNCRAKLRRAGLKL